MTAPSPRCRACDLPMERGFLPDANGGWIDQVEVASWFPGTPESGTGAGWVAQWERRLPVVAYRCPSCGLLQLHAQHRFRGP
jgi:hypothetical protein